MIWISFLSSFCELHLIHHMVCTSFWCLVYLHQNVLVASIHLNSTHSIYFSFTLFHLLYRYASVSLLLFFFVTSLSSSSISLPTHESLSISLNLYVLSFLLIRFSHLLSSSSTLSLSNLFSFSLLSHFMIEISKVSMAASNEKYGAGGNDRIFQNRL